MTLEIFLPINQNAGLGLTIICVTDVGFRCCGCSKAAKGAPPKCHPALFQTIYESFPHEICL